MNQVLLVSAQAMPNFLPVLNAELRPKTVTLAVSDQMRARAEWLKAQIRQQQVEVLPDIALGGDVSDIPAIQDCLMTWAGENPRLMSESVLNVTVGACP